MSKRLKRIRKFANEAAERAFWEKNDSTAYLHWKKAPPAQVVVGRAARYTLQDVHNTLFPKGATQRKACGREGGNPDVHPQTTWALPVSRPHRPIRAMPRLVAQASEFPALKVGKRLLQLLARVHDERAVLGDRLAQRPSRHQDRARRLPVLTRAHTREPDRFALAQHRELVRAHGLGARVRSDAQRAFEHIHERRVVRR